MEILEIDDGNRLIANFLGHKEGFPHKIDQYGYKQAVEGYKIGYDNIALEDLKFHSSWNWLFPCFDKLKSLQCTYQISEQYCIIKSWNSEFHTECGTETTINSAYWCLIQFIKYYNENNKKEIKI
jgi:hypothetical protein